MMESFINTLNSKYLCHSILSTERAEQGVLKLYHSFLELANIPSCRLVVNNMEFRETFNQGSFLHTDMDRFQRGSLDSQVFDNMKRRR